MRRSALAVIAIPLILALAACGSSKKTNTASTATTAAGATATTAAPVTGKVGVILPDSKFTASTDFPLKAQYQGPEQVR